MTPRRDCGDEPVGKIRCGNACNAAARGNAARGVGRSLGARSDPAFARDRQAFSRRLYRLS